MKLNSKSLSQCSAVLAFRPKEVNSLNNILERTVSIPILFPGFRYTLPGVIDI